VSDEREPFLERLGDELERAIELAIHRENKPRHRLPRRRFLRLTLLGFAAIVALSGSAIAARDMLGVIELGNGAHAQRVPSAPKWDAALGVFVSKSGRYVYHVFGGSALGLSCGADDPFPTNNIYVRASRPLSANELKSLLASELAHLRIPAATIKEKLKADLHSHRRRLDSKTSKPLPPGVLSVSNGCPTGKHSAKTAPLPTLPQANEPGFAQHLAP
jgi:hypothetical protein